MTRTQLQRNEDDFISFLIDENSIPREKRNQIEVEFSSEILDWQKLTGSSLTLSESRWQQIRAAFWQRADEKKTLSSRVYVGLAGVMMTLLFFFFVSSDRNSPSISSHISESTSMLQNDLPQEPFESFVDRIIPVDPIPESIWFRNHLSEDRADDSLEELLLVINNITGDFS